MTSTTNQKKDNSNKGDIRDLLLESIQDAVIATTTDGHITYWNHGAEALYKWKKEEVLGKNIVDITPSTASKAQAEELMSRLSQGKPWEGKFQVKDKFGKEFYISVKDTPIFNKRNELIGILGISKDNTKEFEEERELNESKDKFESLYLNSPLPYQSLNEDGSFRDINPVWLSTLGYEREEVIGSYYKDYLHPDWQPHFEKNFPAFKKRGYVNDVQFRIRHKKGHYLDISFEGCIGYNPDGSVRQTYCVFQDITEKQKVQEALKEKNDQLEILNKEYLLAIEKAEESERLKSSFLANMSHEIRTPMNGIMGFIEVLQTSKPDSRQQERYLEIIKRSGDRLLTTINNIVQISRIESGQVAVVKEEINICDFMDYFHEFFKPEAEKKGVEVLVSCTCNKNKKVVYSDKNKLDSILTNLIKNALKFTENGSIVCNCNIEDELIRFTVKDTGSGIQKDRLEYIFDRFVQADLSLTRGYEGSGLGLSIVKAYVEMLGGEIWVESTEGIGTTFYFTLPHEAVADVNINTTPDEPSQGIKTKRKLQILIAEDDEISYDLIRTILEQEGYGVIWAKDGQEAIDIFNNEIDLIFMDLKMPGMDGIEATKTIRKTDQQIPIIAQTAFAFPGDKILAKEAGCNDYISKPILRKDLLRKVNEVFGS